MAICYTLTYRYLTYDQQMAVVPIAVVDNFFNDLAPANRANIFFISGSLSQFAYFLPPPL